MIRLSKCNLTQAERDAVQRVLENDFLGTGPETQAFEQEISEYIGGDVTTVCVNTGTSALQVAVQACGIGTGDEVLVPSLTFVASFQAISATGATAIPCDVSLENALLDLDDAAQRITEHTKAIMPVHYASECGDLDAVYQFAKQHNLRVIEDAAQAFGCSHNGKKIGSFGDVACFSFDGIKNITSGEGGAVVTKDQDVVSRVKDARLLGVEKDTEKRYAGERSWEFDVKEQGWRYHLSDVFAAMGRVQLSRLDSELAPKRVAFALQYRKALSEVNGIQLFKADIGNTVPHIQPIRVLNGRRDHVRQALIDNDIQAGIHYKPNHLLTLYRRSEEKLPVAEQLYEELLTLPLHPALSSDDVDTVVKTLIQSL